MVTVNFSVLSKVQKRISIPKRKKKFIFFLFSRAYVYSYLKEKVSKNTRPLQVVKSGDGRGEKTRPDPTSAPTSRWPGPPGKSSRPPGARPPGSRHLRSLHAAGSRWPPQGLALPSKALLKTLLKRPPSHSTAFCPALPCAFLMHSFRAFSSSLSAGTLAPSGARTGTRSASSRVSQREVSASPVPHHLGEHSCRGDEKMRWQVPSQVRRPRAPQPCERTPLAGSPPPPPALSQTGTTRTRETVIYAQPEHFSSHWDRKPSPELFCTASGSALHAAVEWKGPLPPSARSHAARSRSDPEVTREERSLGW